MKYLKKRVLIYGFGKSGQAAAAYLSSQGALLKVADQKTLSLPTELEQVPLTETSLKNTDFLVLSPGIPRSDEFVQKALDEKIEVVNEPELAFREITAPVVAITGSNGKTTTTTLIGEMLRASGFRTFVGGNIGEPLLHVVTQPEWKQHPPQVVVAELSSYQLESLSSLVPRVAVFTNLSGNHMDRYKTLKNYAAAKHRLREFCDERSIVVLNTQSDWAIDFKGGPAKAVLGFPWEVGTGAIDFSKVQIPGQHNIENFMAAALAAEAIGADSSAIQNVINTFKGIEHRIEFVRSTQGVSYYNDSKSTTVAATHTCLLSFPDKTVHLLMGGRDKGSDYAPLLPLIQTKCISLHLYGEAQEKIAHALQALSPGVTVSQSDTVDSAFKDARFKALAGQNVVLSPACASQDQFTDFEHRGRVFKELVNALEPSEGS